MTQFIVRLISYKEPGEKIYHLALVTQLIVRLILYKEPVKGEVSFTHSDS